MTTEPHLRGGGGWSRRRFLGATATGLALSALGACSLDQSASRDGQVGSDAWAGELVDPPLEKPDVTFTDMFGDPFPFREKTEGKLAVLFFGYTNCPDVCPIYLNTVARSIEAIGSGPGSDAMVLFVGVDVARDTPEQLTSFLGRLNPTFIGLTGTEKVIAQANREVFNPPIAIEEPDENGEYAVLHSARVFPFSPDNTAHRIYPSDVRQADWIRDLPRLSQGEYQ